MFRLYQFWLGVGLFLLALFFGWGLPMIVPSTPNNGILITIVGLVVSAPFFIWAYVLFRRQQRNRLEVQAKSNDIASQIITVSILEEFGYEFEATADSLRLRFSPGIYASPAVRVEDVKLEIRGERYDTDWGPMKEPASGDIYRGCYIRASLPQSFKHGIYQARILACIENRWHSSKPFTLDYQQPNNS